MDQVSLLKAERERHHKALNTALDQATLLREHVDRAHLLSSESVRDRVAVRLINAPDEELSSVPAAAPWDQTSRTDSPGQLQDTQQLLLEGAKVQHTKIHAQAVAELAADAAALQISAAALDKDEEALRKRFVRKRLSLAAAIEDDARLAGLTEAEILEEVRARGAEMAKRQQLLNTFSSRGPGQQQQQHQQGADISGAAYSRPRQAGKVMKPAAMSRRQYMKPKQEQGAESSSSWRPPGFETEYGAYVADDEDNLEDSSAGADAEQGTDEGQDMGYQEGGAPAVVLTRERTSDAVVAAGLPSMLKHMTDQRARGLPSNLQLSDVAAALYATLPQQQEKLAAIKRRAAVTSTRLKWQTKRPQTYAGDLALTAHQRSIKSFVQSVIDELVSSALAHVAMRPTKQQVAVEVAEWKARKPAALQAISRHVGDSIFREVVDDLIGEIASEVAAAAAAANAFSFDMLVAAVAFSQGKYDLGFNVGGGQGSAAAAAGAASGYAGQSKPGGIAREAALLQKAADRETTADNEDTLQSGSTGARLVIKAGDVGAQIAEEDVYVARRDFAAVDNAFAAGLADSASSVAPGTAGAGRVGGKGGQQAAKASARALYLAGLRGMLWEMRDRRPADTPYGHTQPLAPHFTQASGTSKARRLAIARQRPPLIASAAVWARREVAVGRLEPGGWPHARHLAAAARERQFWSMVGLKPRMQKPSLPGPAVLTNSSLVIPDALGSITALSACPAGTFIAAGTNRGGLLVWDLRQDAAVTPWFQVTGTGQLYKRRWWNPWQAKPPRRPAITGFCWSADSYQLAGLDASSNLKLWWMRPEEREDGQSVAELQAKNAPVTPELAVLLTPFMVAISGKAPVAEDDDASAAAANAAVVDAAEAAAAAGKSSSSLSHKLGQWLGVTEVQQKGVVRDVPARQWKPVFHPAFTIAGTQPIVVIPQVTGDVLSICTDIGGPILPGFGPTVFAEKAMTSKGLAAATAAGGPAAAAATSAAVSTEGASIPQAVVDFLMPPQGENPDIVSQAMYRSHDAHVVFLGYLSDATSLLTLDAYGQLALWPTSTSQRSGFGWIKPRKRWQLPRSIRTCLPRSGLHPVWPALPGRAGRGGSANNSNNKGGWGAGNSPTSGSNSTSSAAGSSWMMDGLEQDKEDSELLQQDPQGKFLLDSRLPWMVRYIPSTSGGGSSGLRILRQVSHRPLDNSAPGSNVLVVSSYDAGSGELMMRAKQRCTFSRAPIKVVAAELTPSKRELIIFCSLAPQQDDPGASYTFTVSVINLTSMKALVPRIDTPDSSNGTAPPAYGLSSTLTSLGTEYLFMNLGCAMIGVYSLATGQLVREIATGIVNVKSSAGGRVPDPAGCYFGCLGFLKVSEKQGVFSNAGRTLLVAAAAGGQKVYVLEMDVEGAAQRLLEQREQQLLQQPQLRQAQASLGPLQRQRTSRISMQLPAGQQRQQMQQPGPQSKSNKQQQQQALQQPGSQRGPSQQQQQVRMQEQELQSRSSQQQQMQQTVQQEGSQGRPSQQQQQQVQQQVSQGRQQGQPVQQQQAAATVAQQQQRSLFSARQQ